MWSCEIWFDSFSHMNPLMKIEVNVSNIEVHKKIAHNIPWKHSIWKTELASSINKKKREAEKGKEREHAYVRP